MYHTWKMVLMLMWALLFVTGCTTAPDVYKNKSEMYDVVVDHPQWIKPGKFDVIKDKDGRSMLVFSFQNVDEKPQDLVFQLQGCWITHCMMIKVKN